MIQIYDLNAIQDQEIFLRRDEVRDVSAPVADIIRTCLLYTSPSPRDTR